MVRIDQPAGKVCSALAKKVTLAGKVTIGRNFATAIVPTPVFPTSIKMSNVAPTPTKPLLAGNTAILGLACAKILPFKRMLNMMRNKKNFTGFILMFEIIFKIYELINFQLLLMWMHCCLH